MYKNATVAEWYREHGKHPVYANPRKPLPLPDNAQPVSLKIPKNGRLVDWTPRPGAPARVLCRGGGTRGNRRRSRRRSAADDELTPFVAE